MGRKMEAAVIGALAVFAFFAENYRSNKNLKKEYYTISSGKLPKEFDKKKILFLSDLHNARFGKNNKRLLEAIEKENPDYIFVGGDMLVSKVGNHAEHAKHLMRELAAKYPVYCANGNHEERLLWKSDQCPEARKMYEDYESCLKECGVCHLRNETVQIKEGESWIYVSGLELSRECYGKFSSASLQEHYIEERLGKCKKDSFHVLLAHNPVFFEDYARWGADLTLAGHIHGGIVRLPFLGGVIAPSYQLFPKYDAGLFRKGKKRMIVSVGLGSHSIKVRLFNPPKMDIITLEREEKVVKL